MRRWSIAAALAGLALMLAAAALASFYQKGYVKLEATHSGQSAGISSNLYSGDPSGKTPWSAKSVKVTFPSGTEFGLSHFKACTVSKSQLESGKSCPSDTKIGTGSATATLDVNGKATGSFNGTVVSYVGGATKMILVVKTRVSTTSTKTVVIYATGSGNVLSISVPQLKQGSYPVVLTSLMLTVNPKLGTNKTPLIKAGQCKRNEFDVETHFVYRNGKTKDLSYNSLCS